MPHFIEMQFPSDISFGAKGGAAFSTRITSLQNGHEQRNINWSIARAKYNVAHGIATQAKLDELMAFFRVMQGRATGFRFKDWTDYQGVAEVIGTGDGSTKTFQLVKHYSVGSESVVRIITKPVSGSVVIYKNSVLSSGVSVNVTTGMVTFGTAPASGVVVTADFEFDVPVRFDTDHLPMTLESYGTRTVEDIPLVEVRV